MAQTFCTYSMDISICLKSKSLAGCFWVIERMRVLLCCDKFGKRLSFWVWLVSEQLEEINKWSSRTSHSKSFTRNTLLIFWLIVNWPPISAGTAYIILSGALGGLLLSSHYKDGEAGREVTHAARDQAAVVCRARISIRCVYTRALFLALRVALEFGAFCLRNAPAHCPVRQRAGFKGPQPKGCCKLWPGASAEIRSLPQVPTTSSIEL